MKQDLTRHPELSRRNFLKAAGGVSASVLLSPLNSFSQPAAIAQGPALTDRVNLFLGSDSSAQCIPAAIRPFGMISPETRSLVWPEDNLMMPLPWFAP